MTDDDTPRSDERRDSDDDGVDRLRGQNLIVGLIHLVQAIVIFIISNDFSLPITARFLAGPPGESFTQPETVWAAPVGSAVAVFLLLAAIDHLLMATPGVWGWYRRGILNKINYARWWEYSVSASIMIVLISMLSGVSDVAAIAAIFGVNASMIFFGMVMEQFNKPERSVLWSPFIFGCVAGAFPWIIIVSQIAGAAGRAPADEGPPAFVYAIIISLFLFFNSFAINQVLQYKQVGPWKSYAFGEKTYVVLSLLAKSALAWQVAANTLF